MTAPTADVLRELLRGTTPAWGLQIIKATGRAPGTVYPILARLEEAGWVVAVWEDDPSRSGPRRRLYRLSEAGASEAIRVVGEINVKQSRAIRRPSSRTVTS